MASLDEISIKLGIDVAKFKTALKDANTSVAKLKKDADGDFFGGIKSATKSLNDFRSLIGGSAIAAAVTGFFNLAIEGAKNSTDATDENAAAVRRFAASLNDIKGVGTTIAVNVVGAFNRIGEAVGNQINFLAAFSKGGTEGAKEWARAESLLQQTAKAATEAEQRLAEVRKKHGAEFLAITKELADLQKKSQEQQLKGLDVYETEANLVTKVTELRKKLATFEGQNIDRRRLQLDIAKTQLALDDAALAVRKDRATQEKKAIEDEKKAMEDYSKAADERRKDIALSADLEAELFALRAKRAAAAVAQGKADLSITALQTKELIAQMEIARLRSKLTESLTPAEVAYLEKLQLQTAEIKAQIAAKSALLAASNNRAPVEQKLLDQLLAQRVALTDQIVAFNTRRGVTTEFTAAEGEFLARLKEQYAVIVAQIEKLKLRAESPDGLNKTEAALLPLLQEQSAVFQTQISTLQERANASQVQTTDESQYLAILKAQAVALTTQIQQMRERQTPADALNFTESKLLADFEAQSVSLGNQIQTLEERANSSGGIVATEAELLAEWEKQTASLAIQIATMKTRANSTGGLSAVEQVLLKNFEEQSAALTVQIDRMKQRQNISGELTDAENSRLAQLQEQAKVIDGQIARQKEGGVLVTSNLGATIRMTAAEKDRLALLELQANAQKQISALKVLDEQIQKGVTQALIDQRKEIVANLTETEKQIALRVRISLGQKEDLELLALQSKASATLTIAEKLRLDELIKQTDEKRKQTEIDLLHGKLVNETIVPAERARLVVLVQQRDLADLYAKFLAKTITPEEQKRLDVLIKQTGEAGAQIIKKQILASEIGKVAAAEAESLSAAKQTTSEYEEQVRVAQMLTEELKRQAQIEASRKTTVTNTGDVTSLTATQLQALITKLQKDIALIQATNFGSSRMTPEQIILEAGLNNARTELSLRREFDRVIDFWGSNGASVRFTPSEFARLNQIVNPDATARIDRNTQSIAVSLDRLANDTPRTGRIPPQIGPTR
jgi:hypothetical protein